MSGCLYQLYSSRKLSPGSYFAVNGPHDTHGYVIKHIREETKSYHKGKHLHLVRGITNDEYKRRFG